MSLCSSVPLAWYISEDPMVAPSQPSDISDGGSRSFCKQLPASGLAHTAVTILLYFCHSGHLLDSALKFLYADFLLESCNDEFNKSKRVDPVNIYTTSAKLSKFNQSISSRMLHLFTLIVALLNVEEILCSCILEFDGAAKGNLGPTGAGAVLHAIDGSLVNGLWKTKTQNMTSLCKVAKELKDKFASFQICHVEREFNTEADAQANLGVHLQARGSGGG
ncbi:unnamed protein product [Lactuca saligna]|uniref:RNase H type-1 domain-containing protein n=1 Tax=Lactuca saligna TaxID=75948 RepID=A0AA35YR25_LACSI|nr:unnamed protein product [Lactuca saligna]